MKSAYLICALLCVPLVLAVEGELVNSKYWRVMITKCIAYTCVIMKLKARGIGWTVVSYYIPRLIEGRLLASNYR